MRKGVIEERFEYLISYLTPNKDILKLSKAILDNIWLNKDKEEKQSKKLIMQEIRELEAKKKHFMDRVASTTNSELISEYEKAIEGLIQRRRGLEENLPTKIYHQDNFGTAVDIVFRYLENPVVMWQSENYKDKRLLLEMYFEEKLTYDLKEGFGTATLAHLVNLLTTKETSENHLVEMAGVEPASAKACMKNHLVRCS